jgi:glycosyltransferase involved in cell wall biosynthesis
MDPALLIIVPTLNSHSTLDRLITSLQQQTWPNWRVLFIDGPSTPVHRQWLRGACETEPRCRWVVQDQNQLGIFGAMSQGFALAAHTDTPPDWLMFWGSDDWAAAPTVFADIVAALRSSKPDGFKPDLVICRGRYADALSGALGRRTSFSSLGLLHAATFRRILFFGSTPPHQATLFGTGARQQLNHYAHGFRLSADLDYFLQLSLIPKLLVQSLDLELVYMADAGISSQQPQRRLREVQRAYQRSFGWLWWWPFLARYIRRVASLVSV